MKKKSLILVLAISIFVLGGCTPKKQDNFSESKPTEIIKNKSEETKIEISQETQDYKDNNFGFSFSYPKSLNFELQTPYPGGTIKAIGFRVDGITDSQLLSKDLARSLMSNDLYCNLDETGGGALCSNKNVEEIINSKGTSGYKVKREKTFYDDDGKETIMEDWVYAFPLKTEIGVSTYRAIILTVKMPNQQNLAVLKNLSLIHI
ncbi:MAG: hypothetical protein KIH89_004670, partial [Candidatus Shapirobacteria bacterium]|nr:hypothetical protein [Candidatus Shapirobacteria bacterium]